MFEYPIQVGTQTVRVDYPVGTELYEKQEWAQKSYNKVDYLVGTELGKFVLEIKSPKVGISKGDTSWTQTLSYLKLIDEADYGVLYNGRKLFIFGKDSNDPILTWNGENDISAFYHLSKFTFPLTLNSKTGKGVPHKEYNKDVISDNLSQPRLSEDTKRRIRYTNLKIIGLFSLVSFILGFIFSVISISKGPSYSIYPNFLMCFLSYPFSHLL